MRVDKVQRLVYNDPIVVHKVKIVQRELDSSKWPRKTPIKQVTDIYDTQGKLVNTTCTFSAYA